MELKKALQTALSFEKKGYDIYDETAQSTTNEIVKKTFSYLAEQENIHVKEIKMFIEKEHPEFKNLGDKPEKTKQFFTTTIKKFKKQTTLSNSDIKAYETALTLEKSAYDFYKKEQTNSNDENTKKFFKFLMEQENAHYIFLSKTYEYIKDPAGFHLKHESWIFEG